MTRTFLLLSLSLLAACDTETPSTESIQDAQAPGPGALDAAITDLSFAQDDALTPEVSLVADAAVVEGDADVEDGLTPDADVPPEIPRPDDPTPPDYLRVPDDALVIDSTLSCAEAPIIEAPATLFVPGQPEKSPFVRLSAPPQTAIGVYFTRGRTEDALPTLQGIGASPVACHQCRDFDRDGFTCQSPGIPPQRFYQEQYWSTGNPLFVNDTDSPMEAALSLGPGGGVFTLVEFPVAPPFPDDACDDGGQLDLPSNMAFTALPPCAAITIASRTRAQPFGITYRLPDVWGQLNDIERVHPVEGVPFAWREIPLPPSSACDTAPVLEPGQLEHARVDLEPWEGGGLCQFDDTARGTGYFRIVIPPSTRAHLTSISAVVADGGGYPVMVIADQCDPETRCDAEHAPPTWTDPLRVTLENPGETPVEHIIGLMQGGVGYEGNTVEVWMATESL
ncbi:MAG: hypothetical protein ACE366_06220 [Bradymonadia bacterium]